MKRPTIFIATPTYIGNCMADQQDAVFRSRPANAEFDIWTRNFGMSLLCDTFNALWCDALNLYQEGKVTHFAMLHNDIIPKPDWLLTLYRILKEKQADVVSAVVPIKDNRGLTSTAIGHPTDPWRLVKRLTMFEVMKLPVTFSAADTEFPECPLLVNTGCWICDLAKPWVWMMDDEKTPSFYFQIPSRIERTNGKYDIVPGRSEDWEASRFWHKVGAKVYATREVKLLHYGYAGYSNDMPWGNQPIDSRFDVKYLTERHVQNPAA